MIYQRFGISIRLSPGNLVSNAKMIEISSNFIKIIGYPLWFAIFGLFWRNWTGFYSQFSSNNRDSRFCESWLIFFWILFSSLFSLYYYKILKTFAYKSTFTSLFLYFLLSTDRGFIRSIQFSNKYVNFIFSANLPLSLKKRSRKHSNHALASLLRTW